MSIALADIEIAVGAEEIALEESAQALLEQAIRGEFKGRIALVSSFGAEAAVLLHMVAAIDPATPVLFLDTGKLFDQTLAYRDALAKRLRLSDLRVLRPDPAVLNNHDGDGTLWFRDADACCFLRKVEPLRRGLAPFAAWINGRKRFQTAERAGIALREADAEGRVKFNPLAGWGPQYLAGYMARHDLPAHPLVAEGYASIGCAPCSTPAVPGRDARSGRWQGRDKTECGIHTNLGRPGLGESLPFPGFKEE
ncbi:phosphoadenylyl-sulfate reductase [Ferrovibrio sp.]|uniref:phosphoadenylyl-sulfate reductase n=1 Tax=Ferrovibrio sp. TaxID=1917215 RepID=UPI00345DB9F5